MPRSEAPTAREMRLPEGFEAGALHPAVVGAIEVDAPTTAVWERIAEPGGLAEYHPLVAANDAIAWNAEDARDTLRYFSGLTLHREVYAWFEGEGYDLRIGQSLADPDGLVSWRIEPRGADLAHFSIALHLVRRHGDRPQAAATRDRFGRYLDSIVRGMAHRTATGRAVAEDQFGSVEGFSRA